ncbi:hypothetical protein [Rhodopila sp.]|uniref:hypothetical protein n=1 Tax=Rhodopila sp. TaxID=2480087 RepID=UPI003D0CE0CC
MAGIGRPFKKGEVANPTGRPVGHFRPKVPTWDELPISIKGLQTRLDRIEWAIRQLINARPDPDGPREAAPDGSACECQEDPDQDPDGDETEAEDEGGFIKLPNGNHMLRSSTNKHVPGQPNMPGHRTVDQVAAINRKNRKFYSR